MIDRIHWLGHASFRVEGPPLIYINPWRVARSAFHADVILISNDQYDHCSPADVEKLRGPQTVVIASERAAGVLGENVAILRPWQSFNVGAARITAVPAYTYAGQHPISKGELGFIISIGYDDIYYTGYTDLVPELEHIRADVIIVPLLSGQSALSVEHAAELARAVGARWVVPSHWGQQGGTHYDVQALARALAGEAEVVSLVGVR